MKLVRRYSSTAATVACRLLDSVEAPLSGSVRVLASSCAASERTRPVTVGGSRVQRGSVWSAPPAAATTTASGLEGRETTV